MSPQYVILRVESILAAADAEPTPEQQARVLRVALDAMLSDLRNAAQVELCADWLAAREGKRIRKGEA